MSENKKCVSCEYKKEVSFNGQTFHNFDVKFDGDDKTYQYSAKDKNNPMFKVGEETLVDIDVKTGQGQDGTEWKIYKARPAKVNPMGGGGKSYPKKTKADYLTENLSYSQSYAKDGLCALINSGKITVKNETEFGDMLVKVTKQLLAFSEPKIKEYLAE
jgi:hypothetical protein